MLFGALALSTVTYVGCKDYDDDVKGLQEQIDTINKKGADVTTEAMKTAINSAIADLQSQLDAIAGKADKTALEELKGAVQKLQSALDGKASSEDIATLNKKLEEAIGKVDKSIADAVKVAKEQLQAEIDKLEEELGKTDGKAEENAVKLAELKQQMLELDEASGKRITELELQIKELESIKTRITNLETASANFATIDQLEEYLKTAKEYVDTKMIDYLTSDQVSDKVNAVKEYVDGAFKASILADIKAAYLSLDKYNQDMAELQEQISTFVDSQSQEYKDIFTNISTLLDYKKDVLEVLVSNLSDPKNNTIEKANECYKALNGITDVKGELSKCVKTDDLKDWVESADLNGLIDEYLRTKFEAYDSSIEAIKTSVTTLTGAVKDMLKSLVFLPQEYDANGLVRKVEFISYYTTDDAATAADDKGKTETIGSKLISNQLETKVRFRVSPASAVDALVAKDSKYTITTDKHIVKSRSAGEPFEVIGVSKAEISEGVYEEGVIEVTLSIGSATESYAIALFVTGKDETTKLTEITSDYFAAIIGNNYINKVTYSNADATPKRGNVMYPDDTKGLSFFTAGAKYYNVILSDKDGSNEQQPISLDNLNIPADLFNVTFKLGGTNADNFSLTNNTLMLKGAGLMDECTVTPTVTMKVGDKVASYTGDDETVTVKSKGATVENVVLDNGQKWNTAQLPYILQKSAVEGKNGILEQINAATGAKYQSLDEVAAAASISCIPDKKVAVELVDETVSDGTKVKAIKVTVPAEFSGEATPIISLDFGKTLIVTIPVSVTINKPKFNALTPESTVWDGTSVVSMNATVDGNPLAATLSKNLGVLFVQTEWNALIEEVAEGNVELKTVLTAGKETGSKVGSIAVSGLTNNVYTFTNNANNTNEVTVKFVLYCGDENKKEDEIATVGTIKLTAPDMTGELVVPEAKVIEKTKLTESTDLLAGFKWNDSRAKEMWPKLAADFGNGISTTADALGVYGLSMTYTVVAGDNRVAFEKYFNIANGYDRSNGTLTEDAVKAIQLNDTYQNLDAVDGLAAPITVDIEVKAASTWGQTITNGTTKMTITYPKGTKK